jgi:hypothetical protein
MLYFFANSALNNRLNCLSPVSVKTTALALPSKSVKAGEDHDPFKRVVSCFGLIAVLTFVSTMLI